MAKLGDDIVKSVEKALSEAEKEMQRMDIEDIVITGNLQVPGITLEMDVSKAIKLTMDTIEQSVIRWQQIVASEILTYLDQAMSSPVWYDGNDIIDTGKLRDSVSISISGENIEISYDEPYANLIHYGGYILPYGNSRAELVYIEGKPWAESVIFGGGPFEQYDYALAYTRAFNDIL